MLSRLYLKGWLKMELPGEQTARISRRRIRELRRQISDRDKRVMTDIRTCRYITGRQLMRLHFGPTAHTCPGAGVRSANRHLFRLKEWGLIEHLERRIGGARAGSGANIWHLTAAGHKLLCMDEHSETMAPRQKRHREPTKSFLTHHLAVAELYVRLHELTGGRQTAALAGIQLEPDCWRRHPGIMGGKAAVLKPDAYAVTVTGEYEDHWFMEVDLATESPAVVIRKCEQYARYYQSGAEQREQGVFPRVVWIVPTGRRGESLARHIADNFAEPQRGLFAVMTLDGLPGLICGDSENPTKTRTGALEIRGKESYDDTVKPGKEQIS
jgi:hypothetical protein